MSSLIPLPNLQFEDLFVQFKFIKLKMDFLSFDVDYLKNKVTVGELPDKNSKNYKEELLNYQENILLSSSINLTKDDIKYNELYTTSIVEPGLIVSVEDIQDMFVSREITLNFWGDYLIPSIIHIPMLYKFNIENEIKNIFGKDANLDFLERKKDKLSENIDDIQDAAFLKDEVIELALNSLYQCQDYIENRLSKIKNPLKKIPFTLKRKELLVLFRLLREKEIINFSDSTMDFSKMIEEYFLCNTDKPVKRVYKDLNDYINKKVNIEKASETLEKKLDKLFLK